jgi:hypothetical protein
MAGEWLQDTLYAVKVRATLYHVSVIDLQIDFWLIKPIVTAVITSEASFFFHSHTVHLDTIKVLSPTDAQENCFKKNIKIDIKTAPTCFGVITIIRERTIRD